MSEAATAPSSAAVNAILQPGQSATVFFGKEPATFKINLTGTIQRDAEMAVEVDGAVAETLTFTVRNITVNGRRITVNNVGRVAQGFVALQA